MLRASAVVEGRSITLYEEIHPQARYGHPSVHRTFVRRLAQVVPAGCKLIVMTDAGFQSPWFKLVVEQGWEFVGRIRGRVLLRMHGHNDWIAARDLFVDKGQRSLKDFMQTRLGRAIAADGVWAPRNTAPGTAAFAEYVRDEMRGKTWEGYLIQHNKMRTRPSVPPWKTWTR